MNLKKTLFLLVLFAGAVLIIFGLFRGEQKTVASVGGVAPEFNMLDVQTGKSLSSSAMRGKVVFVNFWASWCQPCKEEMPSIEALHLDAAFNENFVLATILYKDNPSSAFDYMKSNNYTFPVYVDSDGDAARRFGVTGVPETFLIDKKGILRNRIIGAAEWNSPEAKNFIQTLLKE